MIHNKNKIMDDLSLQPRVTEISFYLNKRKKNYQLSVIRICATVIIQKMQIGNILCGKNVGKNTKMFFPGKSIIVTF